MQQQPRWAGKGTASPHLSVQIKHQLPLSVLPPHAEIKAASTKADFYKASAQTVWMYGRSRAAKVELRVSDHCGAQGHLLSICSLSFLDHKAE